MEGAATNASYIASNTVGLSGDRLSAVGNGENGIHVLDDAADTEVIGNQIGGNGVDGVKAEAGALRTRIVGNTVGADGNGDPAGNTFSGIAVIGAAETEVGDADGGGNITVSNGTMGVYVQDATDTVVQFNAIGLLGDEVTPRGNGEDGVLVIFGGGTVIGGVDAGNVISATRCAASAASGPLGRRAWATPSERTGQASRASETGSKAS